jgi:hypothetical protein
MNEIPGSNNNIEVHENSQIKEENFNNDSGIQEEITEKVKNSNKEEILVKSFEKDKEEEISNNEENAGNEESISGNHNKSDDEEQHQSEKNESEDEYQKKVTSNFNFPVTPTNGDNNIRKLKNDHSDLFNSDVEEKSKGVSPRTRRDNTPYKKKRQDTEESFSYEREKDDRKVFKTEESDDTEKELRRKHKKQNVFKQGEEYSRHRKNMESNQFPNNLNPNNLNLNNLNLNNVNSNFLPPQQQQQQFYPPYGQIPPQQFYYPQYPMQPNYQNTPPQQYFYQPQQQYNPYTQQNLPFSNHFVYPNNIQQIQPQQMQMQMNYPQQIQQTQQIQQPQSNSADIMQLKVNLTNLESENIALKEKIKEIVQVGSTNNGEQKDIKDLRTKIDIRNKENIDYKLKIDSYKDENERLERLLKDLKNKEYVKEEKVNSQIKELESLQKDLHKKDDVIKRLNEEGEKFRNHIEHLKRENQNLKTNLNKKENELQLIQDKASNMEKEKIVLNKKFSQEEMNFRNLREDFDNLTKKHQGLKKQHDALLNNHENVKEENFILKGEIDKLNKKIIKEIHVQEHYRELSGEKNRRSLSRGKRNIIMDTVPTLPNEYINTYEDQPPSYRRGRNQPEIKREYHTSNSSDGNNYNREIYKNPNIPAEKFYKKISDSKERNDNSANFDYFFPKQAKIIDNKLNVRTFQQRISELISDKINLQNELFKIPEKHKTVNQINRKKILEDSLDKIENEINMLKTKIRDIKKEY